MRYKYIVAIVNYANGSEIHPDTAFESLEAVDAFLKGCEGMSSAVITVLPEDGNVVVKQDGEFANVNLNEH